MFRAVKVFVCECERDRRGRDWEKLALWGWLASWVSYSPKTSWWDPVFFPVISCADPSQLGGMLLHTFAHFSRAYICLFFERVFDCLVFLLVFLAAALALCKYSLAEWNATDESANRTVSHCHRHGNRDNCTGRYGQVARGGSLFAVSCCLEVLRWRINMRMDKSTDMDINKMQTHLSTETLDRKGNKMRKNRNRCS